MKRALPALLILLRILCLLAMLSAVVVMSQQGDAPFVYGRF